MLRFLAVLVLAASARAQTVLFCRASDLCPCGSAFTGNASGCPNSVADWGATLAAAGNPSVTNDQFVLTASSVPMNTSLLICQGTTTIAPTPFGDGLRCVGGTMTRIALVHTYPNTAYRNYPDAGEAAISVRGNVPQAGGFRGYQAWYRNADPTFCTAATFNMTNAVGTTWLP